MHLKMILFGKGAGAIHNALMYFYIIIWDSNMVFIHVVRLVVKLGWV